MESPEKLVDEAVKEGRAYYQAQLHVYEIGVHTRGLLWALLITAFIVIMWGPWS